MLAALGLFQRATARELWALVLPHQRGDKSIRDALGDLDDAGKVRKELTLPDGRKLWCLTPAGRRDAAVLLPAGAKLAAARPVREKPTAAYSEHALDVAATAGLLAKAGIGRLEAFTTEVEHRLPGRRNIFTDLVLRDPGADVPVLLVEVDRENEGIGTLVDKLTSYRAWCQFPARGASRKAFDASLRQDGPATHALRLWPVLYPATGHEGLPPVALVMEAGRKRPRPGTKPLTPEQRQEKEERDHRRLLRRIEDVETASRPTWYAPRYPGEGITARDYHRALPVVATTFPLLRKFGAGAEIWIRFGRDGWHSLADALGNPDGDRLHVRQWAILRARLEQEEKEAALERAENPRQSEAAVRELRRPACTRCKAKLSDERWAERERSGAWGDDGLCTGCRQADADQQAEREQAAAQAAAAAAAAEAKRTRSPWRR
ncbi:hypothetical protein ACWC5I_17105 [Kitasatospora sp. NPDC001574]